MFFNIVEYITTSYFEKTYNNYPVNTSLGFYR